MLKFISFSLGAVAADRADVDHAVAILDEGAPAIQSEVIGLEQQTYLLIGMSRSAM